tara:strand:+ start:102 stop:518 length:417 start_codon:yes stop_codon:yes gene_type:complete
MNYSPIYPDKNNFNDKINKNRNDFFKVFAEKFFHVDFWSELKINSDQKTAFIVGFYTVIESRCNTNSDETAKLVYNSIKEKCQVQETFDEFMLILEKMKLKCATKGLIPFIKTNIEKNFEVFESLYALYEEKYAPKLK